MRHKRPLGDRREHVRFEVSGQLWASLETLDRAVLRNIGAGGALVEAKLPPGIRTPRSAHVGFGRGPDVNAIIRHVSPVSPEESDRCLVGLEFVNLTPVNRAGIDLFIREWSVKVES